MNLNKLAIFERERERNCSFNRLHFCTPSTQVTSHDVVVLNLGSAEFKCQAAVFCLSYCCLCGLQKAVVFFGLFSFHPNTKQKCASSETENVLRYLKPRIHRHEKVHCHMIDQTVFVFRPKHNHFSTADLI